jgi:PadR family transcriptional regulator, regulatory protein PadR
MKKQKKTDRFYLGEFEEIVLLAILRLRDNAYGVSIRQLIEEETERTTSIGAVYTTLERLESKGYISSKHGEVTAERGGKAKRYFRIEGAGAEAINEATTARHKILTGKSPAWLPVEI